MEANGDLERAKELFNGHYRATSLDPATILALLQIALQLWMWWQQNNVSEPSVVCDSSEPIDMESDDE
jgi:hypothetical protein